MEFSLPLTQDLQNKQVFFGVKVNIGGTESIQYSQGIDIGTVGALIQPRFDNYLVMSALVIPKWLNELKVMAIKR